MKLTSIGGADSILPSRQWVEIYEVVVLIAAGGAREGDCRVAYTLSSCLSESIREENHYLL